MVFLALAAQDVLNAHKKAGFGGTPKPAVLPTATKSESNQLIVTRVIDGDTIVVLMNGVSEKIRLIGVDTPETVDPRKTIQCFGKEASMFTENLLLNNAVRLEADASQGDRDKYGRLLRYVFLEDGTANNEIINKKLIAEGYGHEYTYRLPYKYQSDFKNAERLAREGQKGLWASGVCGLPNMK